MKRIQITGKHSIGNFIEDLIENSKIFYIPTEMDVLDNEIQRVITKEYRNMILIFFYSAIGEIPKFSINDGLESYNRGYDKIDEHDRNVEAEYKRKVDPRRENSAVLLGIYFIEHEEALLRQQIESYARRIVHLTETWWQAVMYAAMDEYKLGPTKTGDLYGRDRRVVDRIYRTAKEKIKERS